MGNLFGFAAFGGARPRATRPAFTPENGAATPDDWAGDCSTPLLRDGTEWRAAWANFLTANLRALTRGSGVTDNNTDDNLIARSVRKQGLNFLTAGGTANALTLTPAPAFASLAELTGAPLRFLPTADNTGAVTLAVSGLAAVAVTWRDGTPLLARDIRNGVLTEVMYDGTAFRLRSVATAAPPSGASTNRAPRLVGLRAGNSGQSVPTSTNTQITGLTVSINNLFGTSAFASNALTVGAGEGGVWQLGGFSHFSAGTALGFVSMSIRVNGTQRLINGEGTTGLTAYADLSRPFVLVPGDVVTWWCFHQAGGSITTLGHEIDAFLVSAV
jgi:hypothetical protein